MVNWDNADLDLKIGKMDANLPGRLECFCSWEYKTSCHPLTLDMDSLDVRVCRILKMLVIFTDLLYHQGKSSESITLHDDDEALSYAVWVQDWKLPAATNIPDMNTHVTIYGREKHTVVQPGDDVQEKGRKDSHK